MEDFKVMVVDDEISVRQGIKNLISWTNEGFELSIEATNGKEALKLMPIFQPHILLTDLVMPEMDGIELISQAKKLNPDIEIIVISSYDTFYLIKECFRLGVKDYILKPELSPQLLLQTLRKVANQFTQKSNEHNFSHEKILSEEISRYLSGYHQSLVLTHLDQLLPYHNYCFFLTNEQYYRNAQHQKNQLKKFSAELKELAPNLYYETNRGDFGYILSTLLPISVLSVKFSEMLKAYSDYENEQFFFTISHFEADLTLLLHQYQQFSQDSDEQYFYFSTQNFLLEQQFIHSLSEDNTHIESIVSSLLTNNFTDGLQLIENYFKQLLLKYPHPNFLKNQVSSLFYTLFTVMEGKLGAKPALQALKMQTINGLSSAKSIIEFTEILTQNIAAIRQSINEQKNADDIISQVKAYVDQYYYEKITLEQIAKRYHYNYQYLSSYFSNKMKLTFNEYLNIVRINKAKELLLDSHLSYQEIAQQVGYADQSYFSKTFKKYTGTTPAKFKKGIHT